MTFLRKIKTIARPDNIFEEMYNFFMNIRRYYSPGQIVFITQVVKDRRNIFNDPEMINLLREKFSEVKEIHKYIMLGYVFLPDHFHILIRPTNNSNFSQIMHSLKFRFTKAYKRRMNLSSKVNIWQRRFWDHVIRDDEDFENHFHYIHHNPVRHGYVQTPDQWDYSSFEAWQIKGAYADKPDWNEPIGSKWGE